jgi:drug/metabolite transporter (DMT)-like permease
VSSVPPTVAPSRAVMLSCAVLLCLFWGSTWFVIQDGLRDLPPLFSAAVRFSVAAALMFPLAPWIRRFEGGEPPPASIWILVGLTNFALSYGIVYVVETTLPSGLVCVLWSVFPMLMAIGGHWTVSGERLRGHQWLGFLGGFAGIVLLFRHDLHDLGPGAAPMAALLLLSPAVAAYGTLAMKKRAAHCSSALINRNGMTLGAALLWLASAVLEPGAEVDFGARAVFGVAYLAVFGTVVSFGLYHWMLRHAAAFRLSLISYVTPAIALLLGWAAGDEPVRGSTLAGTGMILVGVAAVLRR